MKRLGAYFLRGLLLLAPVLVTLYVVWAVVRRVDAWIGQWVPIPVPGAGLAITFVLVTAFGFLASNLLARGLLVLMDRVLARLPLVRFLYTATRDLFSAFVGENRRFDRPVLVTLMADGEAHALGFVTQDALGAIGLPGHVAVYFPQSYNVAGNLVLLPATRVRPLAAESSAVMAFIVSGGVTSLATRDGKA